MAQVETEVANDGMDRLGNCGERAGIGDVAANQPQVAGAATFAPGSAAAVADMRTYAPGSQAALAQGCECPVIDNGRGRGAWNGLADTNGAPVYWINAECPIHGQPRCLT